MLIEYLKCDEPGCDHVEYVDGITENDIGTPCPLCGASLLTRDDFEKYEVISAMMNALDSILPDSEEGPKVALSVGHHDGETTIKIREGGCK